MLKFRALLANADPFDEAVAAFPETLFIVIYYQ